MHIDPTAVNAQLTAWFALATTLIVGIGGLAVTVLVVINRVQTAANKERLDKHAEKLDTLMLHANPPGQSINVGAVNEAPDNKE